MTWQEEQKNVESFYRIPAQKPEPETVKFEVLVDFPWAMHKKGDVIEVLESSCVAYIVHVPDYGDGPGDSGDFDLREFPDIYRLIHA